MTVLRTADQRGDGAMFLKCQNKLDLALKLDDKGLPAKFEINKLNWNYFPVELEIKDDLRQRFYRQAGGRYLRSLAH